MRASVPTIGRLPRQTRFGGFETSRLFALVELMWQVARERSQLKKLDTRMLKDLGLSQDQVEREGERAFYDVPAHRKAKHWY
jgi:uncharacterized protein YjiS (DUF1127 family)